jgi:lipid II:glycine glycyltransferase (peptidoglycan interpeptide bridge formation enzyme)
MCGEIITEASHSNSIFQQPWWLDAVAPDRWSEISIERDNNVVARWPYVIKKRYGLTLLTQPPLTQTLGPWLISSTGKYTKQLSEQKDLMTELIAMLPAYDYFGQNFHYSTGNLLPFFWHGFSQSNRYTYVLNDLSDLDKIWSEFKSHLRTQIRKAQKQVKVYTSSDIDLFLHLNSLVFQQQGIKLPYSHELVRRLDAACVKHQARQIFFAEDASGRVYAAQYLVWNKDSAYALMSGTDPEFRNSGANSLLMWEAIKFAATVTQKFDFEGSMIESIEQFYRSFGAKQVAYHNITNANRRTKILLAGRDLVAAIKN